MIDQIRGEIYKKFRKMEDFAAAAGVSRATVSRVIHGTRPLKEHEAANWKRVLGCDDAVIAKAMVTEKPEDVQLPIQRRMFAGNDMLNPHELSVALRVPVEAIREMAQLRELPHYRFGEHLLFDMAEVKKCCRVEAVKGWE